MASHVQLAYMPARMRPPLIERNPLVFWKAVSFALLPFLVADLALRRGP